VLFRSENQFVSQASCSALPARDSEVHAPQWSAFARLVLEPSYEATLLAAQINARESGSNVVYLTALGGGAFGNKPEWVHDAMRRALVRALRARRSPGQLPHAR